MRRLIALAFACLLLAACASRGPVAAPALAELPALRLAPAALGGELSLQQRLRFARNGQQRDLDALLEVDAGEVRLLVQAMGQAGVRLRWDGTTLEQQRAPWLPPAVRGERVLDDLQFALWPLPAIQSALPAGWTVQEVEDERRLQDAQGQVWLSARRTGDDTLQLHNRAEGYRLDVQSTPLQGDAP